MPDTSISTLRATITASLNAAAETLGEHNQLDQINQNSVSAGVDEANETWNDTLGHRPS